MSPFVERARLGLLSTKDLTGGIKVDTHDQPYTDVEPDEDDYMTPDDDDYTEERYEHQHRYDPCFCQEEED